ncbi:UNVERIFIED_CONTAM: hypothetical protein GTU68_001107 [Idotea baltica]|nr:hypothetical protein [Idotea baltica]
MSTDTPNSDVPEEEVPATETPEVTATDETVAAPEADAEIPAEEVPAWGTGRRKTSVARVRIKDGSGLFTVNDRPMEEYFVTERDQKMVKEPLVATEMADKVDINILVSGGGSTGQTGAVILGIARALQVKDPELHTHLASGGYLTRDGRKVERKKYGLKKARKSFQFSKR